MKIDGFDQRALRVRSLNSLIRTTPGKYELPELVPCAITGITARATATAYTLGTFRTQDALVLNCIKAGTSSGSATLTITDPAYIVDNTTIWAVFGKLAPVAFANNLAMAKGQEFAAGGLMYEVTVAGTTHASDPAPSLPAGGTHGGVTYAYIGKQTLPLVTSGADGGAAPSGTTSQAGWNSTKFTVKGGSLAQVSPNQRGTLVSVNPDGAGAYAYNDNGSGSMLYQTDAPLWSLQYYSWDNGSYHWIDGRLAAFTYATGTFAVRHIAFDATGLPRATRNVRHKIDQSMQLMGIFAKGDDTLRPWSGYSPLKAVSLGDSFCESKDSWPGRVGDLLGIEDWRVSGLGGTGVLRANGASVNYRDRLTVDCIAHNPDIVLICSTQNDQNGVPGTYSVQDVIDTFAAMVARIRSETKAEVVCMGMWNNRGPLASGTAYDIDVGIEALCTTLGVPYIKWRDLLTDGGYVGALSGTGSSGRHTGQDGVHPATPYGARLRARDAAPRILGAIEGLAAA